MPEPTLPALAPPSPPPPSTASPASEASDIHPSLPPDTTSPSYRKALKRHLATFQPASSPSLSAFRDAEKRFKCRFPPPREEVSGALDLALLDAGRGEEVREGWWVGSPGVDEGRVREVRLQEGEGGRKGYLVPSVPGLVILPAFLLPREQRQLVRCCLQEAAKSPNETNLDTHYLVPPDGLWAAAQERPGEEIKPRAAVLHAPETGDDDGEKGRRTLIANPPASATSVANLLTPKVSAASSPNLSPALPAQLLPKLRWANIGASYHWTSKSYDLSRAVPAIPCEIADVCKRAVRAVPWGEVYIPSAGAAAGQAPGWESWTEDYTPDAGIVNFYGLADTLMAHIDHSEVDCSRPLVSLSLGHACVFLLGGATRETAPLPILLRSGDALIMSGPCRRWYHGVPRVLEGSLPRSLWDRLEGEDAREWAPFGRYLARARINVNVRQVFPPGMKVERLSAVAPEDVS
ncbi:hypothetical protein CALCODRAFT_463925 [Calocera cornea HHB12733]|uniref:Fe2OG dioxygenase domain-containing protein n=1 Tax=Calocera cornea HHB12733 TaxID=1353952 RepID=A0A165J8E2_9BASI|nr:hypothetical protein CALCODRAFT_463925 [Calocera cornea HHB12733]